MAAASLLLGLDDALVVAPCELAEDAMDASLLDVADDMAASLLELDETIASLLEEPLDELELSCAKATPLAATSENMETSASVFGNLIEALRAALVL